MMPTTGTTSTLTEDGYVTCIATERCQKKEIDGLYNIVLL